MHHHKNSHETLVIALLALITLILLYIAFSVTPHRSMRGSEMHRSMQTRQNMNMGDYQPQMTNFTN